MSPKGAGTSAAPVLGIVHWSFFIATPVRSRGMELSRLVRLSTNLGMLLGVGTKSGVSCEWSPHVQIWILVTRCHGKKL